MVLLVGVGVIGFDLLGFKIWPSASTLGVLVGWVVLVALEVVAWLWFLLLSGSSSYDRVVLLGGAGM